MKEWWNVIFDSIIWVDNFPRRCHRTWSLLQHHHQSGWWRTSFRISLGQLWSKWSYLPKRSTSSQLHPASALSQRVSSQNPTFRQSPNRWPCFPASNIFLFRTILRSWKFQEFFWQQKKSRNQAPSTFLQNPATAKMPNDWKLSLSWFFAVLWRE